MACGGTPVPHVAPPPSAASPALFSDWNAEAFARAAQEGRPLIISVQTHWCHWCHVMNEETYGDPEVAALLREHFVVIAVDADGRPDIAARYLAWGWPATALLTPDAQPIVNVRGYQSPTAFLKLLRDVLARRDRHPPLKDIGQTTESSPEMALADRLSQLRARIDQSYDARAHGYGGPKQVPWFAPLEDGVLRARIDHDRGPLQRALLSMDRYVSLIDPVAGGMFQYSVGQEWDRPHYEKIHATQADALRGFADAYRFTAEARWLVHAQNIARYVLGTLHSPDHVFYANQDADVGHIGTRTFISGHDYYSRNAQERALVSDPAVDRSVYANNNGMTIASLCALYEATDERAYVEAAEVAMAQIEITHSDGELYRHAAHDHGERYFNDQVEMADALLSLSQATGDSRYQVRLERLVAATEHRLMDHAAGGFFAHTPDPNAVGVFAIPIKSLADNSHWARLQLHMHRIGGDVHHRDVALRTLSAVTPSADSVGVGRGIFEHLRALNVATAPYAVLTVVAPQHDAQGLALYRGALRYRHPTRLVHWQAPEQSHYPYPDRAVLYLCSENACSAPIENVSEIAPQADAFLAQAD